MTTKRAPAAETWEALVDRFDKFVTQPCLLGSGPDMERRLAPILHAKVQVQLAEAREKAGLPATPRKAPMRPAKPRAACSLRRKPCVVKACI